MLSILYCLQIDGEVEELMVEETISKIQVEDMVVDGVVINNFLLLRRTKQKR